MKKFLALMALATTLMWSCTHVSENPVLTIEGGKIQGVETDVDGVYAYKGIPYAAAPINDLRWKAPQPVTPWEGVFVADRFGHPGYQSVHYPGGYTTEWGYGDEAPYSEDCLYLNVWTKAPGQVDKDLPVAMWIHGGGYREGWGSEPEFDGVEWAAKDVVLVSINYRLGIFGFLTYPDLSKESPDSVSGNYGILDQIAALKWIKENIRQFGGDPDNVTIFGQSAGGGSVRTLCESPLAQGLFQKAVIMSAGGLTTPNQPSKPAFFKDYTLSEAEALNKKVLDWAGLTDLDKMRKASTETLYALNNIYTAATRDTVYMPMYPIVDGYVSKQDFDKAALHGSLANVPYMIGYTLNDLGDMGEGIAEFCFNRDSIGSPAWAYQFARPLPTDGRENVLKGAFHSSDLWYVFKSLKHCWRPWTDADWDLSEKMITAWTNFAKYSNPNGEGEGVWTPTTRQAPQFMIFMLDDSGAEASAMGIPQTGGDTRH